MFASWARKKHFLFTAVAVLVTFVRFESCGFYWVHSYGPFKQVERYAEIQEVFDTCDEQTLILFDVDQTLITGRDMLWRGDQVNWLLMEVLMAFKHPLLFFDTKKVDWFVTTAYQQAEHFVFDPDIVRIIRQLQQKGCAVMGLTFLESASYGSIKNAPEWRANILKDFGINFSQSFQDITFTALPMYRGGYPCLHKGILFTNRIDKGLVLGAFLDYTHLEPARVIFFDDSTSFLDSVARECAKRALPFTGYHMVGVKNLPGQWGVRRALVQIDYVLEHGCWLNDQAAAAVLAGGLESANL